MKHLTKQQRNVLGVILLLLLTGLAVKTWRTAHPPRGDLKEKTAVEAGP